MRGWLGSLKFQLSYNSTSKLWSWDRFSCECILSITSKIQSCTSEASAHGRFSLMQGWESERCGCFSLKLFGVCNVFWCFFDMFDDVWRFVKVFEGFWWFCLEGGIPKIPKIKEAIVIGSGLNFYKEELKNHFSNIKLEYFKKKCSLAVPIGFLAMGQFGNKFNLKNASPIYIRNKVVAIVCSR